MRYRLCTLLIVLAIGPILISVGHWYAQWLVARNLTMPDHGVLVLADGKQIHFRRPKQTPIGCSQSAAELLRHAIEDN